MSQLALSASLEYLCYVYTAIITILLFPCRESDFCLFICLFKHIYIEHIISQ